MNASRAPVGGRRTPPATALLLTGLFTGFFGGLPVGFFGGPPVARADAAEPAPPASMMLLADVRSAGLGQSAKLSRGTRFRTVAPA